MKIALYLLPVVFLCGCVQNVQPWEKASLAKESMKEGGMNTLIKKYDEHIYYSKEGTKGGGAIGAGGCGCN